MRVAHDYGKVRIVYDGSPFEVAYDIKVEVLEDGEWKLFSGFNSLSDDYATTNARDAAQRAIKGIAERAAKALV
jgi:hypothetical protein